MGSDLDTKWQQTVNKDCNPILNENLKVLAIKSSIWEC